MPSFILASTSPRRKELLLRAGYSFDVQPSHVEETFRSSHFSPDAVKQLAYKKGKNVYERFPDRVVLSADTVVVKENQILGKPSNSMEAKEMLERLSGSRHDVYTAVAICSSQKEKVLIEKTTVHFYPLSPSLIASYLETEEPYDKAGSYGIQGFGALFVRKIEGDYYNVVGLPLSRVYRELHHFSIVPSFTSSQK